MSVFHIVFGFQIPISTVFECSGKYFQPPSEFFEVSHLECLVLSIFMTDLKEFLLEYTSLFNGLPHLFQ